MLPQETTVISQYYIDNIFEVVLLPGLKRTKRTGPKVERKMTRKCVESVFAQDGAHAHLAKMTHSWCSKNLSAYIWKDGWLPNSSDLNPVENLWTIAKETVFYNPAPTTNAQLK